MNNMTSRINLKILFLFFFCILSSKSFGVIERYSIVSQNLFTVTPSNIYTCYDSKGINALPFTNYTSTNFVLNTDFKFRWIRNSIKVSIDRSFTDFIPFDRDIRVKLEVNAQNQNGASVYTNEIIYLDLKYRPGLGMVEDESSSFRFEGAVVISVRVIGVLDFNGNPITNFNQTNYPKVKLDTEIEFDRIYVFNPNTTSSTAFKSSVQFNNLVNITNCYPDDHEVLWNQVNGAEAWELEWQFIEDDYDPFTNFVTVDYRHNSSRVRIESFTSANPRFKIPGILEKGYLVFRVRPIGYNLNTFETVYGDWSMDDVTEGFSLIPPLALNVLEVQNYNEDLNWIRTTTFAEEAKYKSVVSYYDGVLKQRQAVTISTTDQMPIVAQTIYDFSGRPAVQVLPTPALDGNVQLCFRPAFNKNTNGQAYTFMDFDLTDGSNCPDPLVVSEMSDASGASKYYSSQGLTVNSSPWQSYVPDADGYPFTQVEYTADNTGRIARSGMAGKTHRLSGVDQNNLPMNGKESRFYYGKPFQEQLYMMFGADVGNSEHYKRNVSIDPNGQASVTYIDPYGKTVATSLAGDPNNSPNLEALPSSSQYFDFKVSSFTNNIQGRSKVIQQSLIVTDAGMHSIRYTVDPRAFSPTCAPEGVCYDCVYDLEVSLLNECGDELIPVDKRKVKVGNIQPFDLDCDAVGFSLVPDGTLDLLLQPGQYTLRKTLTVNKDALNYYRRAMLSNNTCLKSLNEFIDEEKEQMGLRDNCLYTCLDCQYELNQLTQECDDLLALGENLTTIQENRLDELQSMIQHQQELCNELCKVPTPCDILIESILADMRPGGQYATTLGYEQQTGILTPNLNDNYSIFNEQNQLLGSCQNANWRHPRNPEINGSQTDDYYNQDGSLALIKVINGLPEIQAGKNYYDVNGNEFSGNGAAFQYIKPKDLKNVEDFIDQYMTNPSWAHSLKQYHPEYCLFEKCKLIEPTYEYNNKLLAEDDAQQALLKGYFNPVNNSDVTYSGTSNTDPYASQEDPLKSEKEPLFGDDLNMLDFNSTGLAWFKNHLWDYPVNGLNPGKSIWDLYNDYNQSHTLSQSELECTGDPGWPFLRALYIAAKDDILRDYYLSTSNCQSPYINCPTCNSNTGGCQGQINIPEGKLRRFPLDANAIQGTPLSMQSGDADDFNEGKDFVDGKVKDQCQSKCDSYKEYWARQLQGCSLYVNLSQVHKDNMLSDLSKVCVEGCDIDNPLGSRQVSPKNLSNLTQGEPTDFHQVFVLYFGSGAWLDPNICDELILEWPLDYGHDYSAYDGPYSDTCACNKKAYATSNPNCSPNSIPEPMDDCACEIKDPAVRQATLMQKEIPDELKCQNCVDCRRFNIAYARFELRYCSTAIGQMSDALFEALLEKWMNLDLGFNLKYSDYLTFAGQCKQISTAPDRQIWTNFKEVRWVMDEKYNGKELQLDDSSIYFLALNTFLNDLNLTYSHLSDSLVSNVTTPERIQSNPEGMIAANDGVYGMDMSSASIDADKLACHCEKILTARWYKDKELQSGNMADDKGVYERMFGPGPFNDQAEFDKAYKVCCNAYYESVPANPDCQQTGFKPGDKFSSMQKNYFDNHVLSPNTDPAFVNNTVNDHQLMIDANCNNSLTTDYTLAPADNCACDKLMAAKQAYQNLYPGHYGNSTPPLNTPTFEQYIQSQYGVTGYDLVKITENCIKNWNSGSGEDPNGQPNPWPGVGATWSKISKENLAQDVMDDDLKVPQGLLCQPPNSNPSPCRAFPPDCYTLRWILKEFLSQTTLPAGINLGNPYVQGTPEYGAYNFYSSWESFYELFMNNKYSSNPDPSVNAFFDAFAAFANSHSLVKMPCNVNTNYSTTELLQKFKACLPLPCKPTCTDFETLFSGFLEEMAGQITLPSGLNTNSSFKDFYEGAKVGYYNDNDWKDIVDNFLTRANFIVSQRCPKANIDVQYTFTQIWGMLWHCFNWTVPEGVGQEQTKPVCTSCFKINYDYLDAFEKFLNQINKGQNDFSNSPELDKLQFDNWKLEKSTINNNLNAYRFYNSILYSGNSQSTLRYHIDKDSYGVPFMEVLIDDANGFKFGYTLEFPGKDDIFNYGMIQEFKNIRPLGRINCGLPKGFEVDVIIILGDAYEQQNVNYTMTGTFTFGAYADYTECFDTCVRLCNKPLIPKPVLEEDPCEKVLLRVAYSNALMKYHDYLDELDKQFEADYVEYCMGVEETLELEYTQREYHFTLYQYDQAGNLIKTVPPEGVDFTYAALSGAQRTQFIQERIDKAKAYWASPLNGNPVKPKMYHTLMTHYKYNTLNQPVWQNTPDGGITKFWYDALGRLVVTQNSKQLAQGQYSYVIHDGLGRTIESGIKSTTSSISPSIAASGNLNAFLSSGTNSEVTRSLYDAEASNAPVNARFKIPRFALRGRVLGVYYYKTTPPASTAYFGEGCDAATHYGYDIHGNINELIQELPLLAGLGNQFKHLKYSFDLLSGKTNQVSYQEGEADQMFHRYAYDADNRLVRTESSRDGWDYKLESKNFYYLHGPLARVELGPDDQKVQGLDYAYTINGWLKALNGPALDANLDMGKDGNPAVVQNSNIARDGFAYMLGYHNNDYFPVGGSSSDFRPSIQTGTMSSAIKPLYNGNISYMQTSLPDATTYASNGVMVNSSLGNVYFYDQLNRLVEHKVFDNYVSSNNSWPNAGLSGNDKFHESFTYDAAGNILTLTRNGDQSGALAMDEFNYRYSDVNDVANRIQMYSDVTSTLCATVYPKRSHKLFHVDDNTAFSSNYADDIDDQGTFNSTYSTLNTANNYAYDELGNLIKDNSEQIASIEWTNAGKISKVLRTSGSTKPELEYLYDATGSRMVKIVKPRTGGLPSKQKDWKYTVYVKDGSGNIMAVYELTYEELIASQQIKESLKLKEVYLYSSERLGIINEDMSLASMEYQITGYNSSGEVTGKSPIAGTLVNLALTQVPNKFIYQKGKKIYELTNHLGNVMATLSDRSIAKDDNLDLITDYYNPDLQSISDYYAFGSKLAGRNWSLVKPRFGFNGEMFETEYAGDGVYDLGERFYESRLGRMFSVDPLEYDYPWQSTFAYCKNSPISIVDIKGLGDPLVHKVSSGESLFQLAKKYNTTIDAIKNSNTNIDWNSPSRSGKKKDWIYKGESIIIPNTYTEDIESFSNYANQTVKASMPDFVWIGLAAHRALKIYILSLNLTNPYRPWYFDRSIAGKFELSRPDVVYDDYVVGGVWECKPLGSIYAKKEAELYARKLNEFRVGRFGVGTTKGAPSPFIGFLPYIDPVTKIMFEFTIDNNSGSIFYTVLYNPYKDPTLKPKFVPFKITLPKDPITIGPKYPLPIFPVPIRSPVPVYNRFGF